jgi:hypothetical protein
MSIGWAAASITPPPGLPTYGYSSRLGAGIRTIADSVFVKGVAIQVEDETPMLILSADICMWVADISAKIVKGLSSYVPSENIYFGVTHTHSGPGGYAKGPVDRFLMGGIDEVQCQRLVEQTIRAGATALTALSPGTWRPLADSLPQYIQNRVNPDDPIDSELVVFEFRKEDGEKGILTFFGAHATTVNAEEAICSGDYPSALNRFLLKHGYSFSGFIASATGQAGPTVGGVRVSGDGSEQAQMYGDLIGREVMRLTSNTDIAFRDSIELATLLFELRLPEFQYRVLQRVLSPLITGWMIGSQDRVAAMHGIRVGNMILVGQPFEASAVSALTTRKIIGDGGKKLVITGFNRDNFFYVVPAGYYSHDGYESSLTLFGPHFEAYLEGLTTRLFQELATMETHAGNERTGPADHRR